MNDDLTFTELRLASMLHIRKIPHDQRVESRTPERVPRHFANILADMVIQVDRLAAAEGVDLAAAIRARFKSCTNEKVLHGVTPENSPTGEGEDKPFI